MIRFAAISKKLNQEKIQQQNQQHEIINQKYQFGSQRKE